MPLKKLQSTMGILKKGTSFRKEPSFALGLEDRIEIGTAVRRETTLNNKC